LKQLIGCKLNGNCAYKKIKKKTRKKEHYAICTFKGTCNQQYYLTNARQIKTIKEDETAKETSETRPA